MKIEATRNGDIMLRIPRPEFLAAIQKNWQGKAEIRVFVEGPDCRADFIEWSNGGGTPTAEIPIPSWNHEGSGEEFENLMEFSRIQPEDLAILDYPDFLNDPDENIDPADYIDYFEYAEKNGWVSVRRDWENWVKEAIEFLADDWDPNALLEEEYQERMAMYSGEGDEPEPPPLIIIEWL